MLLRNRLVPLALFVLSFAVVMRAQDRANCSNATLHGGYGLHALERLSLSGISPPWGALLLMERGT